MPGMLAEGATKLCQRQTKQLSEFTEVIFNIHHSQSSANTRLVATQPAKCTLHYDTCAIYIFQYSQ